jgi:transcriptional regulator with XRE-family HTH domain
LTLGEKIKGFRTRAGLSQEQLAEKLCVSRQAITKWENDRGIPDINNLQSIANLFDVSIDSLVNNLEGTSNIVGVTEKLINKAILRQSLIYFLLPLGLAIIHSLVGIIAVSEIFTFHYESIIVSSLFLVIIYGAYFYATYVGVKNIVKNSN